jgi:hypothetical protein
MDETFWEGFEKEAVSSKAVEQGASLISKRKLLLTAGIIGGTAVGLSRDYKKKK